MSDLVTISTDEEQLMAHADWAELQCLIQADRSVSREDLARALKRPGFVTEDSARELADQAFDELNDRAETLAGSATNAPIYPYKLDSRIEVLKYIRVKARSFAPRLAYMFLLAVSRHGMSSVSRCRLGIDPTLVFERMCAQVLRMVMGGDSRCFSYHLGTGNDDPTVTDFPSSISKLCQELGEGGSWKSKAKSPGAGDGGVDVVAWRAFADRRPGNLVGFAQCKTGVNWREHISRLRPSGFCGKFMTEPLILEPRSIFMVPHRIRRAIWEDRMREGGTMLLDRCRIVEYASTLNADTRSDAEKWLRSALSSIKAVL